MPENVNTAPLEIPSSNQDEQDERPTMVKVNHVSMIFNMANQQLNSLKEYAIAVVRRELMFKEFRALDDVSFKVKKGDVFGILGTNGSGKSTMLKIVAGVLEPTKGICSINGSIAPLIELGAGFDMELTARENIFLNGSLLGYSRSYIKEHFDEIVEFAEIEKFLDTPMKNYSSGMVARIAFAIATVIVPEILIVDEVLSVGDFMFQQKCERRITQLIKEYDVTVLIVSHDNEQIKRLCNKAIWIEKGHTRMLGTAENVCRAYQVLGGRIGTPESEKYVYNMLSQDIAVPTDLENSISGETRFSTTAKLVAECNFRVGGDVIIAPGDLAAPCLAATGFSGVLDAPVLLAKPNGLPDATVQELKRLRPHRVFLVGDLAISSDIVERDTREACDLNTDIVRVLGTAPTDIAVSLYRLGAESSIGWGRTAVITYDECIGDLITFSPFLFKNRVPVFFIRDTGIIDGEVEYFLYSGAFDHLLVLGGIGHVPDAFLASLNEAGIRTERICAKDPYAANELINEWMASSGCDRDMITIERLIVTSVWNPSDTFAAGAYAAKTHSAFLLEDPQNLDSVSHALTYIEKKCGQVKHLTFLGDNTRFTDLDKEILGKAVVKAMGCFANGDFVNRWP